ncbi:MAG: hypothetical protein RL115_1104 [Bacteroidota bacterium]
MKTIKPITLAMMSQRGTQSVIFFLSKNTTKYERLVSGNKIPPIKYPMIIMVAVKVSRLSVLNIANTSHKRIQTPQIRANLDKNKSQRMGYFSVK